MGFLLYGYDTMAWVVDFWMTKIYELHHVDLALAQVVPSAHHARVHECMFILG